MRFMGSEDGASARSPSAACASVSPANSRVALVSPAPLRVAKIMEREAALMALEDFELNVVFP